MAFPWRKWRQNIATFILATLSVFAANRQIWLWYTYSLDKQSVSTYYNNCSLLLGYSISLCTRKILSSILCIIFLCNKTELVQTIVDFTVSKFCLFWKNTIFTLISILNFFKCMNSQTFVKIKSQSAYILFVFINVWLLKL